MGLIVTSRPLGNKVITAYTVDIQENTGSYPGMAEFIQPVAITGGDWIYIQGNVENYNGFWQATKDAGTHVVLTGSVTVPFLVTARVTVYTCFNHYWNCVHLPIVYKLHSTYFPTNVTDPIASISIIVDSGGFLSIGHSALSGANALLELDFVTLSDGVNTEIAQVLDVLSTTNTVVNSKFRSVTYTTIQKYRNNYHAIVNLYAGLNASHSWASLKPYELAATLKFIPDENNNIQFSISEILKAYITQRNGTLQATLPLDLDSFTQFYISVAEGYDASNAYTIGSFESSFTPDSAEPYTANSKLEFKNRYSGFLSDYIMDDTITGSKFLTLFDELTIFSGKYFDVSYIINDTLTHYIFKVYSDSSGNYLSLNIYTIPGYNQGLYRTELTSGSEAKQEITIVSTVQKILAPSSFISGAGGGRIDYDTRNATQLIGNAGGASKNFSAYQPLSYPNSIKSIVIPLTVVVSGSFNVGALNVTMIVADSSGTQLIAIPVGISSFLTVGTYNVILTITENSISVFDGTTTTTQSVSPILFTSIARLYFVTVMPSTPSSGSVTITVPVGQVVSYDKANSETKTVNIDSICSNQSIYLTWRNNLGGMDYWNFTAFSEFGTDIGDTGETKTNIFPSWPNSYGENASEIRKQTFRDSSKRIVVSSQNLTLDQKLAIEYLKSSTIVEIMYSRSDKRRVIVDKDSFVSYRDNDKLYTVSFNISFTDNIPAQRL